MISVNNTFNHEDIFLKIKYITFYENVTSIIKPLPKSTSQPYNNNSKTIKEHKKYICKKQTHAF